MSALDEYRERYQERIESGDFQHPFDIFRPSSISLTGTILNLFSDSFSDMKKILIFILSDCWRNTLSFILNGNNRSHTLCLYLNLKNFNSIKNRT